jgi:two-component sensor histidine kinase
VSNAVDLSITPANETGRLAAIHRYDVLDTPPDGAFDRVTSLAANLFSTPISIISIVDTDRIWFKSHHGVDAEQIDREPGLCASAILHDSAWLLENAELDPRSLANSLVAGAFGLRFYLGVPLRTHDGFNLGTLCVIDREPRTVSQAQIDQLTDLASIVMDQMELRRSARFAVGELSLALDAKDAAIQQQALMAREIDHRVKNSLQLVASLLALQSREAQPDVAEQIQAAARRVSSIARLHEHLYSSETADTINARDYLTRLAVDLASLLPGGEPSNVEVDVIDIDLPTDRIVAIGLIVNELVTNAAKQGATKVAVTLHYDGGDRVLTVANDGNSLPAGFDLHKSKGLGLKVVLALAQRFHVDVTCVNQTGAPGVAFVMRAPAASL